MNLVCTDIEPARFPRPGRAEIAVSGRSNVGKSSLLNMLLGRRNVARVSKQPGKTQTINFFLVNDRYYLVDLPGYGYAKVSKKKRTSWQNVISRYLEKRESLSGVIQLIDIRREPARDDLVLIQKLVDRDIDCLVVFTKSDKVGRNNRQKVLKAFRSCFDGITTGPLGENDPGGEPFDIPIVYSSSKTGEGKDDIWRWVNSCLNKGTRQ